MKPHNQYAISKHMEETIGLQLGWRPATPLRRTVEHYAEWVLCQPDVKDYYEEAEAVMERLGTIREATPR